MLDVPAWFVSSLADCSSPTIQPSKQPLFRSLVSIHVPERLDMAYFMFFFFFFKFFYFQILQNVIRKWKKLSKKWVVSHASFVKVSLRRLITLTRLQIFLDHVLKTAVYVPLASTQSKNQRIRLPCVELHSMAFMNWQILVLEGIIAVLVDNFFHRILTTLPSGHHRLGMTATSSSTRPHVSALSKLGLLLSVSMHMLAYMCICVMVSTLHPNPVLYNCVHFT